MGRQVSNRTKSILKYTSQGMPVKEVAKKLKVSPQVVYNTLFRARKRAESQVKHRPTKPNKTGNSGIAAVKRTENVETGITALAPKPTPQPAPIENTKPSIWQRIKRVLGWQ